MATHSPASPKKIKNIIDAVETWLDEQDWEYAYVEKKPKNSVIRVGYQGQNGRWMLFIEAREEESQLVCYSVFPVDVDDAQKIEMMEFIIRANDGIVIGNFDMNLDKGQVRYRVGVDLTGLEPHPREIEKALQVNLMTMDWHLPGLAAVLQGKTAKRALDDLEKGMKN